ncbi:hypothetical protein A2763_03075 [Candidatus Kaiserbacteria bacterium RIFCSPHIGHO2_01_FULL_54_36]|uniref:Solute-binding protein family 5 domain-containing protein n=1 Tax=Candidatus Kaiserbacteria bacterium RIFCSPHIGHO2_01_FULL_54_36 TaxID=1798482 RepID=A0A1F6CKS9_9BACT|nr:MAG: hypothetical protein A2763_03075 [Candidatus Kaiserbacteria bacterium RIFCSPHIGHO2_01_FULL_54_36]OGG75381.1 MAG: hypothetical protein A3A41_02330 [Candidatus Kaiserbacteria bacterium RIFCSPLOWO2_01_FULL_54_22]
MTLTKERTVGHFSSLGDVLRTFSPGERLILYAFTILLGISALALLAGLNSAVSVTVPTQGGTLVEGEVGPARFINPILMLSQPDEDLSMLVYSGLTRVLPEPSPSGAQSSVVPDLASHYEVSEDGTTYTFTLREDATFHDGSPVTADDVIFTVEAAQDPAIKSPRRADWEGVQVSATDEHTVVFKLAHAYAPFIENTTLGILPKHIWGNVPAEEFPFSPANTHPIGSGPYRVLSSATDATGSATRYDLVPFRNYTLGEAYVKRITFVFYPNQEAMLEAFNARKIDAIAGVTPADLSKLERTDFNYVHVPLPRVFGVFFNQSHAPVLADTAVRVALDQALDKEEIVRTVLNGYGRTLDGPIPPGSTGDMRPASAATFTKPESATSSADSASNLADTARATLKRAGWTFLPAATSTAQAGDEATGVWKKKNVELAFSLATAGEPELLATANKVAAYWRAAGIKVEVQVYSLSELNTTVLRPRAYDAILFGEVVGRTADLFAFWHSSQRNDPGLNLALYANSRVDSLLSQARATTDFRQREKLYEQFSDAVANDTPAIFLYAPEFIYLVPSSVHGITLGSLTTPAERYVNIRNWYTDTEKVWNIFTEKSN